MVVNGGSVNGPNGFVEPDNRRCPSACEACAINGPQRSYEQRGRLMPLLHWVAPLWPIALPSWPVPRPSVIAGDDDTFVTINATLLQMVHESFTTSLRGRQALRAADERNPTVPQTDQVIQTFADTPGVIHFDVAEVFRAGPTSRKTTERVESQVAQSGAHHVRMSSSRFRPLCARACAGPIAPFATCRNWWS